GYCLMEAAFCNRIMTELSASCLIFKVHFLYDAFLLDRLSLCRSSDQTVFFVCKLKIAAGFLWHTYMDEQRKLKARLICCTLGSRYYDPTKNDRCRVVVAPVDAARFWHVRTTPGAQSPRSVRAT